MTVATLLSGFNIFYLCHYRQRRHLPSLNALVIICIKAKSGLIRHESNMVLAVLAFTDLTYRDFSSTCLRCSAMRLLYDP